MPRETIEIVLSEVDPYYAGAQFLAAIAYPDPLDKNERDRFMQAVVRWTLGQRVELDPDWARGPQLIRPAYFSGPERPFHSALKRGVKKLNHRIAVAQFIVMPHLRAIDAGRLKRVKGFYPSINNMTHVVMEFLNWHGDSQATVKSKIWKPSRPVAHAAAAYVVWHQILWKKWGRNPDVNKQLAFLMLPEYVDEVVGISEIFREQLQQISQFTIREDETVQFVVVNLEAIEQPVPPSR
jgi:hypothetical protein